MRFPRPCPEFLARQGGDFDFHNPLARPESSTGCPISGRFCRKWGFSDSHPIPISGRSREEITNSHLRLPSLPIN